MLLTLLLTQGTAGPVTHDTSGALSATSAAVAGSSTRFRAHASSGVLPGQTATITGAADREAAAIPHTTEGALTGPGAVIDGAATRFRAHATSGVLLGGTATITGDADHESLIVPHVASGDIVGPGASVVGSAFVSHLHATSGDLPGQTAVIVGDAELTQHGDHDGSGDLVGPESVVSGEASRSSPEPVQPTERGDGVDARWTKKQRRERDRKLAEERDRKDELRQLLKRALDPVTEETAVEVVTVDDGVVVIPAAGKPVAVPRPEGIDLRAMSREIGKILSDAKVQAERTRRAQSQEIARVALEQARENVRRLIRKRRQEEFLLLMT